VFQYHIYLLFVASACVSNHQNQLLSSPTTTAPENLFVKNV